MVGSEYPQHEELLILGAYFASIGCAGVGLALGMMRKSAGLLLGVVSLVLVLVVVAWCRSRGIHMAEDVRWLLVPIGAGAILSIVLGHVVGRPADHRKEAK